ncbi:MAG: single-stranded DNA-binding protein [Bacteroidales bacterium]|nr:single-stranded DNA-binding protein [Bacteroidales bacterium]
MIGINRVTLLGNLGQNPDTRYVNSALSFSRLSLATTDLYTNLKGEQKEETQWHTIVAWRELSNYVDRNLRKGDTVFVEGKIKSREIVDKDGFKRKVFEIIAEKIQLVAHHDNNSQTTKIEVKEQENNVEELIGSGLPDFDIDNLPNDIKGDNELPF